MQFFKFRYLFLCVLKLYVLVICPVCQSQNPFACLFLRFHNLPSCHRTFINFFFFKIQILAINPDKRNASSSTFEIFQLRFERLSYFLAWLCRELSCGVTSSPARGKLLEKTHFNHFCLCASSLSNQWLYIHARTMERRGQRDDERRLVAVRMETVSQTSVTWVGVGGGELGVWKPWVSEGDREGHPT